MQKDSEDGPLCEGTLTAPPRIDFQPNDWYTSGREPRPSPRVAAKSRWDDLGCQYSGHSPSLRQIQ